ncbi:MAG TPA: amino acid ABC transporter permease [Acidimicrobiales bacterium]|nr:amino acid ABC transporter permease [Acidimicrobiales bacterium]
MTAPFVADALGPRGRRRVLVSSVLAGAVIVLVFGLALNRLADKGQLSDAVWAPLRQWSVQKFLLLGLWVTVKTAVAAMVTAVVVGVLLALGRLSRNGPVRWLSGAYVEVFRAMPLILLMYFVALALPKYSIHPSPFQGVVLALTIYNGAVLGEIFRAGILSLDRGQSEAASALGMTYWQSMLRIIVPQAARRMIPAIVSQLVTLLKDTSLGTVILLDELLTKSRDTGTFFHNRLQVYTVAALLYIAVNFTLSRVARRLEVRQRRKYKAGAITVTGVEDLAVLVAHGEAAVA